MSPSPALDPYRSLSRFFLNAMVDAFAVSSSVIVGHEKVIPFVCAVALGVFVNCTGTSEKFRQISLLRSLCVLWFLF